VNGVREETGEYVNAHVRLKPDLRESPNFLTMIVRDEEGNLARSLASVEGLIVEHGRGAQPLGGPAQRGTGTGILGRSQSPFASAGQNELPELPSSAL
jgi:hypothetical protein